MSPGGTWKGFLEKVTFELSPVSGWKRAIVVRMIYCKSDYSLLKPCLFSFSHIPSTELCSLEHP